jgi:thiol-disulfide isomerase/thioredoxin
MKKITLLLALLGVTFTGFTQVNNYNLGDVVDDFTVTDTEGNEHNLYSITAQGKYVFLDFFFVDCGPCQTWQPTFSELHDKYGCNEGEVYCLSINRGNDTDEDVIAYEEMYGGPFNHAPAASMDGGSGAVDNNFGVSAYPTFCLINPNNEIINLDIWPLSGVETFEATFPTGFEPEPASCNVLNIGGAESVFNFAIYPNPVAPNALIQISLSQVTKGMVTLYGISGQKLYNGAFEGQEISLDVKLSSGTYFVAIDSELGSSNRSVIVK